MKSEPVSPSKTSVFGGATPAAAGKEKVVLPHFSEIEAAVAAERPYGGLSRGLCLMDVEAESEVVYAHQR